MGKSSIGCCGGEEATSECLRETMVVGVMASLQGGRAHDRREVGYVGTREQRRSRSIRVTNMLKKATPGKGGKIG